MARPYDWQLRVNRIKTALRRFWGANEAPRPKMCPACGTLVGVNATRCHQCGTSLTFSLAGEFPVFLAATLRLPRFY